MLLADVRAIAREPAGVGIAGFCSHGMRARKHAAAAGSPEAVRPPCQHSCRRRRAGAPAVAQRPRCATSRRGRTASCCPHPSVLAPLGSAARPRCPTRRFSMRKAEEGRPPCARARRALCSAPCARSRPGAADALLQWPRAPVSLGGAGASLGCRAKSEFLTEFIRAPAACS